MSLLYLGLQRRTWRDDQSMQAVSAIIKKSDVLRAEEEGALRESVVWEYSALRQYTHLQRELSSWSQALASADGAPGVRPGAHTADVLKKMNWCRELAEDLLRKFAAPWSECAMGFDGAASPAGRDAEQSQRYEELGELWRHIVPQVARDLVRVCSDTGSWVARQEGQEDLAARCFSKAMQVADLMVDADLRLSDAFERDSLADFLDGVRVATVELLACRKTDRVRVEA